MTGPEIYSGVSRRQVIEWCRKYHVRPKEVRYLQKGDWFMPLGGGGPYRMCNEPMPGHPRHFTRLIVTEPQV